MPFMGCTVWAEEQVSGSSSSRSGRSEKISMMSRHRPPQQLQQQEVDSSGLCRHPKGCHTYMHSFEVGKDFEPDSESSPTYCFARET
jgi:hypothetical protein